MWVRNVWLGRDEADSECRQVTAAALFVDQCDAEVEGQVDDVEAEAVEWKERMQWQVRRGARFWEVVVWRSVGVQVIRS